MTEKQNKNADKEVEKEITHLRIQTPDGRNVDLVIKHLRHERGLRGMIDQACKTTGIKPRVQKYENAVILSSPVKETISVPEKIEKQAPNELPETSNQFPETSKYQLSETLNLLPKTLNQLSVTSQLPETLNQLSVTSQLSETLNQLPETQNQLSEIHNQLPETPNQLSETPNQPPETLNQLSETPNQLSETQNQLSETPNQIPETLNQPLETPNQLLETPNQPPETPNLLQTPHSVYDASMPYMDFRKVRSILVSCIGVKFGSYKIPSNIKCCTYFSTLGIKFVINFSKIVEITLRHSDMERIVCLKNNKYSLIIKAMSYTGESIRRILKISNSEYNPDSSDNLIQSITVVLKILRRKTMNLIKMLFPKKIKEVVEITENLIFDVDNYDKVNERAVLVYPEKQGVAIYPDNLTCLSPINSDMSEKNMLNDNIVNFYLQWIYHNMSEENRDKFFIFSSMFLLRLTSSDNEIEKSPKKRHSQVAKWTKNIDILSKEYIIIPFCINFHWVLIIVCFPNEVVSSFSEEIPKNDHRLIDEVKPNETKDEQTIKTESPQNIIKPEFVDENLQKTELQSENSQKIIETEIPVDEFPQISETELIGEYTQIDETPQKIIETELDNSKRPCILIFDSLHSVMDPGILKILREYLSLEYAIKHKGKRCIFSKENLPQFPLSLPQQQNLIDCGLFTLQYVQEFCKNPFIIWEHFTTDKIINLKNWFDLEVISRKRQEILDLIQKLKEVKNPQNNTS